MSGPRFNKGGVASSKIDWSAGARDAATFDTATDTVGSVVIVSSVNSKVASCEFPAIPKIWSFPKYHNKAAVPHPSKRKTMTAINSRNRQLRRRKALRDNIELVGFLVLYAPLASSN